MAALACRESLPHRHKLGEQPGGSVSQLILDLDLLSFGRLLRSSGWVPQRVVAGARCERPSHRTLSLHLFFTQHAPAGRSCCSLFYWYLVSRASTCRTMEAA